MPRLDGDFLFSMLSRKHSTGFYRTLSKVNYVCLPATHARASVKISDIILSKCDKLVKSIVYNTESLSQLP